MRSHTILQYGPAATGVTPLRMVSEVAETQLNQTTSAGVQDGLWYYSMRRNGQGVAARMQRTWGPAPGVHALLDPTTPIVPAVFIFEDWVYASIAAGACEAAIGFVEHVTANTPNTLVGIGFRVGPDHVWHTFVNDCPGNVLPVTVRRDTTLAGQLSTTAHRMTIKIDGRTRKITWLIDGVEVDSWTPSAPLDQMGVSPGPLFGYTMIVPAAGDATLRVHGGGAPQLRMLW